MDNNVKFTSIKVRIRFVLFLLLVGAPMFFIGGPGAHGSRSFVALWDLGHVLFFALTSWLLHKLLRARFPETSLIIIQIYIFLIVLIAGITVERLQVFFDGRSPSFHDILRNQLGYLIIVAFFDFGEGQLKKELRSALQLSVALLLVMALCPLGRAVIDEQIAARQFPVLSDFETPFEIDRWAAEKKLTVQKGIARHGKYSLKVQLTTNTYSGVGLIHFPGDWSEFKNLYISVFYPEDGQLELVCRIHDSEHNNEYADRFNKRFVLEKGWNDLVISLADIERAPVDRFLNISKIENLKLFVVRQEKERIIYIDNVHLEK